MSPIKELAPILSLIGTTGTLVFIADSILPESLLSGMLGTVIMLLAIAAGFYVASTVWDAIKDN